MIDSRDDFAELHSVDFAKNTERHLANNEPKDEWAIEYAERAPIFHVTTVAAAREILAGDEVALLPHAALHTPEPGQFVENTPGRTASFDVEKGLDQFVFSSLGKVAEQDSSNIAIFVLSPDIAELSLASPQDIAAMGAIILAPEEQFNERADQTVIDRSNDRIFDDFLSSTVHAEDYRGLFASYLTEHGYSNEYDFLTSFGFTAGVPNIPKRGTPAYREMVAHRNFTEKLGMLWFNTLVHGEYYAGPQLMTPQQVGRDQMLGCLVLAGADVDQNPNYRMVQKFAQRQELPTVVLAEQDRLNAMLRMAQAADLDTHSAMHVLSVAATNVLASDFARDLN